jgi:hypothetical protein
MFQSTVACLVESLPHLAPPPPVLFNAQFEVSMFSCSEHIPLGAALYVLSDSFIGTSSRYQPFDAHKSQVDCAKPSRFFGGDECALVSNIARAKTMWCVRVLNG